MNRRTMIGGAAALGVAAMAGVAWVTLKPANAAPMAEEEAARLKAWDFRMVAIDGEPMPMQRYRGKVVLLVNTASFCGFTPQYAGLQKVQDAYAARGFTIVGVPSGDFMGQEYDNNGKIKSFCQAKGVRFPLTEKAVVTGGGALPIYRWAATRLGPANAPKWNFHKYLIGRDGAPIAAFGSSVEPSDPKLRAAIDEALRAPAAA